MPNKICTSCALLLRAALKLRSMCQQAEEQLQKVKHEQEQQQLQQDSGNETPSDFIDSYEVTLETASIAGSQDSTEVITIKPAASARAYKATRRNRTIAGMPPTCYPEASKPLGVTYVCNICNNVYTEKVKLTTHLKLHSVHKPHECE